MSTDDPSDILDDAKDAWQADDPSGDRGAIPEEQLLRHVKEEAEAFDERIRWRDRREMIAAGLVFVFFATMLLDPSWLVRIGALIVMGSSGLVVWVLRRARRGERAPAPDRPLAERVRAEREKVDTQIRLLETVLWWYIAPMAVGLGLVVLGDDGLSWFTLGYGTAVAVFCGGVYLLNHRTVRRSLRPRRKRWTRLLRRLEESLSDR
jgi:hypothetical protein